MRAFALLALAACGGAQSATPTPTPATTSTQSPTPASSGACKTNDDCAMSTTRSCCGGCDVPPFAELKSEVEALTSKCAVVECTKRQPQECKPTASIDDFHAECKNAACVAVKNAPPSFTTPPLPPQGLTSTATCATDAECVVADQRPCCSSCPENAYATSKKEVEAERHRCAAMDCAKVAHPQCAEFVSASEYRAVCRAGTCAGVKR